MKNWKSMLFALLIFAALFTVEGRAQEGVALDSTEVAMLLRDSDNAHKVARAALGAVSCILGSLSGTVEGTPQGCAKQLEMVLEEYGQEHLVLHPMVLQMLQRRLAEEGR